MTTRANKRLLYEFDDLAAITTQRKYAKLHGVVTEVSTMTESDKYFEGTLADEKGSVRVVGFDAHQQQQLSTWMQSKQPVEIVNCKIQKQLHGQDMEVVLGGSSEISASPRKYDQLASTVEVKLNQVEQNIISDGKRVSVLAKIQKLAEPIEIKPGLYKQDATIADNTGFIRLTLWQRDIGKLDQGKSYRLHNVVVKSFNATKYLMSPKAGLHSTPADDLDDVVCQADSSSLMDEIIQAAEVVGINDLVKFNICMKCNSTVDEVDSLVGTCSKCTLTQRLDKCPREWRARLLLRNAEQMEMHELTAFQSTIRTIAENDLIDATTTAKEITTALLTSSPFNCTSTGRVIKAVDRD